MSAIAPIKSNLFLKYATGDVQFIHPYPLRVYCLILSGIRQQAGRTPAVAVVFPNQSNQERESLRAPLDNAYFN
jgi:hypothetical protein